jgi:hypothetical protein
MLVDGEEDDDGISELDGYSNVSGVWCVSYLSSGEVGYYVSVIECDDLCAMWKFMLQSVIWWLSYDYHV